MVLLWKLMPHDMEGVVMDCILLRHGIAVGLDEWKQTEANRFFTQKRKGVLDRLLKAGRTTERDGLLTTSGPMIPMDG